jgi:hypothetical protein
MMHAYSRLRLQAPAGLIQVLLLCPVVRLFYLGKVKLVPFVVKRTALRARAHFGNATFAAKSGRDGNKDSPLLTTMHPDVVVPVPHDLDAFWPLSARFDASPDRVRFSNPSHGNLMMRIPTGG